MFTTNWVALSIFLTQGKSKRLKISHSSFLHDGIIAISHQFYLIVQQQIFIMIIRFSLHASILNFNFSQCYRISQHLRVFSQHYRNLITAIDVFLIARSTLIYYTIYRVTFDQGSADFLNLIKISQHFEIASSTDIK